ARLPRRWNDAHEDRRLEAQVAQFQRDVQSGAGGVQPEGPLRVGDRVMQERAEIAKRSEGGGDASVRDRRRTTTCLMLIGVVFVVSEVDPVYLLILAIILERAASRVTTLGCGDGARRRAGLVATRIAGHLRRRS